MTYRNCDDCGHGPLELKTTLIEAASKRFARYSGLAILEGSIKLVVSIDIIVIVNKVSLLGVRSFGVVLDLISVESSLLIDLDFWQVTALCTAADRVVVYAARWLARRRCARHGA